MGASGQAFWYQPLYTFGICAMACLLFAIGLYAYSQRRKYPQLKKSISLFIPLCLFGGGYYIMLGLQWPVGGAIALVATVFSVAGLIWALATELPLLSASIRAPNEEKLRQQISEMQELSKSLTEKNRQLEDFAQIVSHNLRSPVRNLRLLIEFYFQEQDPESKTELVNKIGDVSNQLTSTLADLTEVINSRPSTEVVREQLVLEDMMEALLRGITMQVREVKASISWDFSALTAVQWPKVYLESALLNLVTNALKYRHPDRQPVIKIRSWVEQGCGYIAVQDNGLGIDLELHGQRLFGLHNTFHDHEDARGMGLFITRNQVEALGGKIMVESTVDVGSTFTLSLGGQSISA